MPSTLLDRSLAIARVAMAFGDVPRATCLPDGRFEPDTTHTVMLAMLVPELAALEGLDIGLAVQFAVVHDLAEVYAGDTNTARALSADENELKAKREAEAAQRLEQELGRDSWAMTMLRRYESMVDPEARLVRHVDKILPKLTHALNHGVALEKIGMSVEELHRNHKGQRAQLRTLYPEFEATDRLFVDACNAALSALEGRGAEGKETSR